MATDIGFTVVKWANGAKWSKNAAAKDFAFEQPDLLSQSQVDIVIDRINESVNIWGLSESVERNIIEAPVTLVNGKLKEALASFMVEDWHQSIQVLLDETAAPDAKRDKLKDIFDRQLREPLAQALNGVIDIPMIGEGMEDKLFHMIVDKVLATVISTAVLSLEKTDMV